MRTARANGDALTGPTGLLKQVTAMVLEAALEEEMTEHLGHAKHQVHPAPDDEMFDRFARDDDSRSRAHGSTGLGLAIAQGIARAHHGDLAYQPNPTGGSHFRLTLP